MLLDQFEIVPAKGRHLEPGLGNVIKVVRLDDGQGGVLLRNGVVDLSGRVEGQVWLEQPHGQKERLLMVASQKLRSPSHRGAVAHFHCG